MVKFNIPVYWINLDMATKRKELFISENYPYFKTITRVSAIDGANLQRTVKHNSHFQLSPAEIATAFSHLIAIETAFKDNCEYALILEDDNSVKPIITNNIDLDAIPNTIKDWDVLQLLTSHPRVLKIFSEIINGNKTDDPYYQTVSDLWVPWKHWFHSAGAYIINKSSMKILVDTYLEKDGGGVNLRDHLYPVADIIVFDRFRTYTSIYTMFEEFDDNISQIHPDHTPTHRIGKDIVRRTKVPENIPRMNVENLVKEKPSKVCFKSFWNGFPLDEQEFIANLCFEDFQVVDSLNDADYVISGVFSKEVFKDKKWIHMSGEPFIIEHPDQNLVISSYKIENEVYYSFGLHWLYYEKLVPNLLEHRLISNVPKKFCCFISSSVHPVVERKFFYDILSKYKNIDSWGTHNNNMGSKLSYSFSSPQFREFLSGYKFMISFENCSKPGYITEKLFNPLLSNIIPIYWGSKDALQYINKDRIIYLEDMSEKSVTDAIDEIVRLDKSDEAYLETVNKPTVVDKNDPVWDISKTQKYIRDAVKQRFSNEPSLYDHIFVVNLDSRKDRLESVTKELEGFKWERFSAVKSQEVPDWFMILNKDKEYRIGSYGCLQSHYNIIKLARERNYNRVLILEDDTGFKNSIDILYKAVEQLNSKNLKWGLLYLSGNHMEPTVRIDENVVKCIKTYTTNSYIVDSSVYDMILDDIQRWPAEIDVFYSKVIQKKVNCYCTRPHVTYQKSGRSDILNKDVVYEGIHMIDP